MIDADPKHWQHCLVPWQRSRWAAAFHPAWSLHSRLHSGQFAPCKVYIPMCSKIYNAPIPRSNKKKKKLFFVGVAGYKSRPIFYVLFLWLQHSNPFNIYYHLASVLCKFLSFPMKSCPIWHSRKWEKWKLPEWFNFSVFPLLKWIDWFPWEPNLTGFHWKRQKLGFWLVGTKNFYKKWKAD